MGKTAIPARCSRRLGGARKPYGGLEFPGEDALLHELGIKETDCARMLGRDLPNLLQKGEDGVEELGIRERGVGLVETVPHRGIDLAVLHTRIPSASTACTNSEWRAGPSSHWARVKTTGTTTIPRSKPASQAQWLT